MTLEFGILGPLEVRDDGTLLEIRPPIQRLVLAVLLLRAGEVVSKEALIDALWGDEPVVTASKTLQMRDFAAMLIVRAGTEDPRLATQLLDDAQAAYDSLGMAHWATRCEELRLSAQTDAP